MSQTAATSALEEYSCVTERPGQRASRLQLQMMGARYGWAARYCEGKDVLEVACGAGTGLDVLARAARSVVAGDVDRTNLADAHEVYGRQREPHDGRIALRAVDALKLPFEAASFDVVLLFEALYYLDPFGRFLAEARRVLRSGGVLLLVTVNCEWRGFNPSPYSSRYLAAAEIEEALRDADFAADIWAGFPQTAGLREALTGLVRRIAVRLDLIPRTMGSKAWLKRLFYGRLEPVPGRIAAAEPEGLRPALALEDLSSYRVLYAAARRL